MDEAQELFRIEPPSSAETRALLRKFVGYEAEELWLEACRSCGLGPVSHGVDELERIAGYLIGRGSLAGVVGQGLLIRIRVFRNARAS